MTKREQAIVKVQKHFEEEMEQMARKVCRDFMTKQVLDTLDNVSQNSVKYMEVLAHHRAIKRHLKAMCDDAAAWAAFNDTLSEMLSLYCSAVYAGAIRDACKMHELDYGIDFLEEMNHYAGCILSFDDSSDEVNPIDDFAAADF